MNASEAAAHSLDKLCQDSVNDLMATIAKLDSNGVQVNSIISQFIFLFFLSQ